MPRQNDPRDQNLQPGDIVRWGDQGKPGPYHDGPLVVVKRKPHSMNRLRYVVFVTTLKGKRVPRHDIHDGFDPLWFLRDDFLTAVRKRRQ